MANIKTVIFDFDGTITTSTSNIWKDIYLALNLPVDKTSNYYTSYIDFVAGKYDYATWVKINQDDFVEGKLNSQLFYKIVDKCNLIDGLEQTCKTLKQHGINLYILSGNFVEAIQYSLGELTNYFTEISANNIIFDKNGNLDKLVPTKYDFEQKATYITQLMEANNLTCDNICFVGNGDNDIYAYKSKVKTICINPLNANENNSTIWSHVIHNCNNLTQILDYIIK